MNILSQNTQKGNPGRISLLVIFSLMLLAGSGVYQIEAASRSRSETSPTSREIGNDRNKKRGTAARGADSKKKEKGAKNSDQKTKEDESEEIFLVETKENQAYLPDIYRCSECGYEQDEAGTCPDHEETALVLVRSKGKNPLEPAEVDGNEDLIVDMPVTGLAFKKSAPAGIASSTVQAGVPMNDRKEKVSDDSSDSKR
ncbi:MAG: hypothetical protein WA705_01385 [Candidatus Ozemobacteraceae bacterium]